MEDRRGWLAWVVLGLGMMAVVGAWGRPASAQDTFAAFGVPRSNLLDTAPSFPLGGGVIPWPGSRRAAERPAAIRRVWHRRVAAPFHPFAHRLIRHRAVR